MNAFVGVSERLLTKDELKNLLQRQENQPYCYFLRSPHQVEWIVDSFPDDFASPEGQMFNRDRELRWKQKGDYFSVLLLSANGGEPEFRPLGQDWEVELRDAQFYPPTETRLPKGLPSTTVQVKVAQRYFKDRQTATVHFVALTRK